MKIDRAKIQTKCSGVKKVLSTQFKKYRFDYMQVVILLIASFVGIFYFFHLWNIDLHIPLSYSGKDDMSSLVEAKLISQTSETTVNNSIGAPFGSNSYDFPANMLHGFDNIILKASIWIFKEPALSVNMFYLSLFIMIGLISFFVMRQLRIRPTYAILGSLTFEFMPYIFIRGINHIVLSAYMFVPLSILLCIWSFTEKNFLVINKDFFKNKKNIVAIISTILIANNGIAYYAFFTCLFLFIVMISKTIKTKSIKAVQAPIILIALVSLFTFINLIPSFVYDLQNGRNALAVSRSIGDAEVYGLKITQLFLPVNGHGIPILEKIITKYNSQMPLVNENSSAYLGILGIVGFLALLLFLFRKKQQELESENIAELTILSEMNIFTILFATIGGFSSIFSMAVSEVIRSHNRISIFIAYICILSVMLMLEEFGDKYNKKVLYSIVVTFCILGILEQAPANLTGGYLFISKSYKSDAAFVTRIESMVPKNAMIYQMPYHKTPEGGPINNMADYQLYVGYIHSKDLRWSYGAIKGRYGDKWFEAISNYPLEKRLKTISLAGYSGIYIDKRAYTKEELTVLNDSLKNSLGQSPIESNDKNLLFFNMAHYNQKLKNSYSIKTYQKLKGSVFELNQ